MGNYFFKNTMLLVLMVTIFGLGACHKKNNDDTPSPDHQIKEWMGNKPNTDDTISVQDSYVYLSTKYSSSGMLSVSSSKKITGDFELRLQYSSFHPTGTSSSSDLLGFSLIQEGVTRAMLAGLLTNSLVYISDSTSNALSDVKSTANREGEFYIKRMGSAMNAWMRAGTDTVFFNKSSYTTADLTLTFEVGALDNTVTRTSAHIDDFSITGGGGSVVSDPFDKDNIVLNE